MKDQVKGVVSLCLAAFLWGLWGVFARLLGLGFGVFYQCLVRSLILLIIFSAYVLFKKSWRKIEKKDIKWFFVISIGGVVATVGSFIFFNYLTIGTALFYFYVGITVGGYFIAHLFFYERLTKIKLVSLALCLAGLLLVFYSTIEWGKLTFIILALIGGFGGAAWNVFSKKVTSKYSLAQVCAIDNFNFVVICFALTFVFREPIIWPSFSLLWLYVVLFSLMVLAASVLNFYGFKYSQAQTGSLIMLLEAVFGVLFGWLFYREILTIFSMLGGVLILLGAALPNLVLEKQRPI